MELAYKKNIIITVVLVLLLYFLYNVRSILLPFILGGLIAYFLGGITKKLDNVIHSRKISSIIIICVFTLIILTAFIFVIPILLNQLMDLVKELGNYFTKNNEIISEKINTISTYFQVEDSLDIKKYLATYSKNITSYLMSMLNNILSTSIAFISVLSLIIITPITAYYFLNEWNNIIRIIKLYLPKKRKKEILIIFKEIDEVLSACIKGQLNVCVILGLFYGTLLAFNNIKYGFLVGLLTGLASFVPYFGMLIGFFIAMIITVYQFGINSPHAIATASIFIMGQFLEGNFITPKLVGSKIHLHPLWIIFALFSGGTLFGFVGLILALPLAGIIGVLVRFFIREKLNYNKI